MGKHKKYPGLLISNEKDLRNIEGNIVFDDFKFSDKLYEKKRTILTIRVFTKICI